MSDCQHCDKCCVAGCNHETFCEIDCGCCCEIPVLIVPNRNLVHGTIMAQRTTDMLWDAYNPNASDGLQIPRGVLRWNTVTDAEGNIQRYTSAFLGMPGCGPKYTNVYFCGTFKVEETVGNLAAALSHESFGRIVSGFIGSKGIWKLI